MAPDQYTPDRAGCQSAARGRLSRGFFGGSRPGPGEHRNKKPRKTVDNPEGIRYNNWRCHTALFLRSWRNRHTRTFEGRVLNRVRVQVPSTAPFENVGLDTKLTFFFPCLLYPAFPFSFLIAGFSFKAHSAPLLSARKIPCWPMISFSRTPGKMAASPRKSLDNRGRACIIECTRWLSVHQIFKTKERQP